MCLGGPGRETKGRQGVTRPGRTEETGEKPERRIMSGTQNVGVKSTTTTVYSPTVLHNSTAQHAEAQRRSTSQQHIVEAQHSTAPPDLRISQACRRQCRAFCSMIGIHWIIRGSGPGERANAMGSSPDPKYCPLRTSPRSTLTHTRSQCGRVDPAA